MIRYSFKNFIALAIQVVHSEAMGAGNQLNFALLNDVNSYIEKVDSSPILDYLTKHSEWASSRLPVPLRKNCVMFTMLLDLCGISASSSCVDMAVSICVYFAPDSLPAAEIYYATKDDLIDWRTNHGNGPIARKSVVPALIVCSENITNFFKALYTKTDVMVLPLVKMIEEEWVAQRYQQELDKLRMELDIVDLQKCKEHREEQFKIYEEELEKLDKTYQKELEKLDEICQKDSKEQEEIHKRKLEELKEEYQGYQKKQEEIHRKKLEEQKGKKSGKLEKTYQGKLEKLDKTHQKNQRELEEMYQEERKKLNRMYLEKQSDLAKKKQDGRKKVEKWHISREEWLGREYGERLCENQKNLEVEVNEKVKEYRNRKINECASQIDRGVQQVNECIQQRINFLEKQSSLELQSSEKNRKRSSPEIRESKELIDLSLKSCHQKLYCVSLSNPLTMLQKEKEEEDDWANEKEVGGMEEKINPDFDLAFAKNLEKISEEIVNAPPNKYFKQSDDSEFG